VAAVTLVVFLAGAVLISPVISLVVIALGAVLYVCFLPVRGIARKAGQESKAATRSLFQTFLEAIAASREIKAYGVGDYVRERVDNEITDLERPAFRLRVASGFVPVLYQRLVFLILLGGVGLVYILEIKDLGAIGASLLIVLRAMQQAQSIQAADPAIAESLPWVGELKEGRERYRTNRTAFGSEELTEIDEIEFTNVTYSYGEEEDALALDGITFTARRGELLGVIGPSGSGKSTLSELIVRLDEPTSGTYRVNGRDASEFTNQSWTRRVVLVPQTAHLIAASIADNIRFLRPEVSVEQVREASDRANLTADVTELEDGFETEVGERGHRGLSGGQRQRLSIARAVALPPSLIVLDEPTSALDHKAEGVIVETIEALRHHALVVVIAHRLSTLRHCDRVLVLRDGKVEAFCSPAELAEQSEFFRAAGTVLAP
jgi:ABC-type multidrug transport system fused ATPase/permease subunit